MTQDTQTDKAQIARDERERAHDAAENGRSRIGEQGNEDATNRQDTQAVTEGPGGQIAERGNELSGDDDKK
jgi:hypothetical protein